MFGINSEWTIWFAIWGMVVELGAKLSTWYVEECKPGASSMLWLWLMMLLLLRE